MNLLVSGVVIVCSHRPSTLWAVSKPLDIVNNK
jgi:hypothetical protein